MIVAIQRKSSYVYTGKEEGMILYILRHAIAAERGTGGFADPDRPLTEEGIDKMEAAAGSFPLLIGEVGLIASSPYRRARETAMIAARHLKATKKVRIVDILASGSTMNDLFTFLNESKKHDSVLMVGHEPDLSILASTLIGVERSAIELKKGSLCALSLNGPIAAGCGTLLFLLQPKQLRALRIEEKVSRQHRKKK